MDKYEALMKVSRYCATRGTRFDYEHDIAILVRSAVILAEEFLEEHCDELNRPQDELRRARVNGFISAAAIATRNELDPEDFWMAAEAQKATA